MLLLLLLMMMMLVMVRELTGRRFRHVNSRQSWK